MAKIHLGVVGGGGDSWIGKAHRVASTLDERYSLQAGCLSSDERRAERYARALEFPRSYSNYQEMARQEGRRQDGVKAVLVVTPNELHPPVAQAFVEQGIHVISDKPLAYSLAEVDGLRQALAQHPEVHFFITHNYSGYSLVRQMKQMISAGDIGQPWWVEGCYLQDWLLLAVQAGGSVEGMGSGGVIPNIGSHLFHLFEFVLGDRVGQLANEQKSWLGQGGPPDSAYMRVRTVGGVQGQLSMSQVAAGHKCNLALRVYGSKGSLHWGQENPTQLVFHRLGSPSQTIIPGVGAAEEANVAFARLPAGHPEGYYEAFAQIYRDAADVIEGKIARQASLAPGWQDALQGIALFQAAAESHRQAGAWVDVAVQSVEYAR